MIRNRTHEIEEIVRKNIACVEKENPVSLFMKNLQSGCSTTQSSGQRTFDNI